MPEGLVALYQGGMRSFFLQQKNAQVGNREGREPSSVKHG